MNETDLIQRYLAGTISEQEVLELENLLRKNVAIQEKFILQAEIEAALRSTAQSLTPSLPPGGSASHRGVRTYNNVKWVSGLTVAIALLFAMLAFNIPSQRNAFAYPSLGKLNSNVSWKGKDIWGAARQGDLPGLRREIQRGADLNAKFDGEYSPLHIAAAYNQIEAVNLLLKNGAEVSLSDHEGNSALHMATFFGNTNIVKTLLGAGADAFAQNSDGFIPRDLVAITWSDELEELYLEMEILLDKKLDMNHIRDQRLVIQNTLNAAMAAESFDQTPTIDLFKAATIGDADAVRKHIKSGSNLNAKESVGGNTPLMLTAIFGTSDCAKLLIEAGANPEATNNSQGTALHLACFFCQPVIVEMLLNKNVDTQKVDIRGMTAREIASAPWTAELRAIYGHVYDSLDLEIDFDHIQNVRSSIAESLSENE